MGLRMVWGMVVRFWVVGSSMVLMAIAITMIIAHMVIGRLMMVRSRYMVGSRVQ